jgi:hypothetical protein
MPGSQQLQLGSAGHQPLAGVEHLAHVAGIGRNSGHADQRPAVQVRMPRLSRRDIKPLPKLSDHRSDQGALLLQGMNVTEQDVQFQSADVHHSPPPGWSGAGFFTQLVGLDLVADLEIVIRREREAALEALPDGRRVILEPAQ